MLFVPVDQATSYIDGLIQDCGNHSVSIYSVQFHWPSKIAYLTYCTRYFLYPAYNCIGHCHNRVDQSSYQKWFGVCVTQLS